MGEDGCGDHLSSSEYLVERGRYEVESDEGQGGAQQVADGWDDDEKVVGLLLGTTISFQKLPL